jgi:hypothetical protein
MLSEPGCGPVGISVYPSSTVQRKDSGLSAVWLGPPSHPGPIRQRAIEPSAGKIRHRRTTISAHCDNSVNNKFNPNPNGTVYICKIGNMTWEEMDTPLFAIAVDKT